MANVPIRGMTVAGIPAGNAQFAFDDGQMKRGTLAQAADAIRPVASQAEAEDGTENTKTMTPLRVSQSVDQKLAGLSIAGSSLILLTQNNANATTLTAVPNNGITETSYRNYKLYIMKPANGSNGPNPTLNINGLGAKPIYTSAGFAAGNGEWRAKDWLFLKYDNVNDRFEMLSPTSDADMPYTALKEGAPYEPTNITSIATTDYPVVRYSDRTLYELYVTQANAADGPTISIDGLTVIAIHGPDGEFLSAQSWSAGDTLLMKYEPADGPNGSMRLLDIKPFGYDATITGLQNGVDSAISLASSVEATVQSLKFITKGFCSVVISNNGGDASNDIDFLSGECADITNTEMMAIASTLTKRLDAAWAVGTGNGGLDTGSKANSTTYHTYVIKNTTDGSVDALFSTSPSSPTMPSGYTVKRRVGMVMTDSSGVIRPFRQNGGWFYHKAPRTIAAGNVNTTSAAQNVALVVPTGVKVLVDMTCFCGTTGANTGFTYFSINDPDLGAADITSGIAALPTNTTMGGSARCFTNTAGEVSMYSSQNGTLGPYVRAWYDHRDTYF